MRTSTSNDKLRWQAAPAVRAEILVTMIALCFLMGCGTEPEKAVETRCQSIDSAPAAANIVLVTLCSFRMSHSGLGEYHRPTTPFLDELASSGTLFTNAVSASSWTKPATASLLTGVAPNVHQMLDFYREGAIFRGGTLHPRIMPDTLTTLAECLQEAGFATAARSNNVHVGPFFNTLRGFENSVTSQEASTRSMLEDLEVWLQNIAPEDRFLFFLFTRDAHTPYRPSYNSYRRFNRSAEVVPESGYEEYRNNVNRGVRTLLESKQIVPEDLRQQWVDLYDAGLADMDEALRALPRVLHRTGFAENTILIVTADHGERLFDNGKVGHGKGLDEPVLEIPLIMAGPGMPAGKRIPDIVRSIDVFPTLAQIAGVRPPALIQGRSLIPLLEDRDASPERMAFSTNGTAHALRAGAFKLHLTRNGKERLYDVENDPGERLNLAATEQERKRILSDELARWTHGAERIRAIVGAAPKRALTASLREQLQALGYLPPD